LQVNSAIDAIIREQNITVILAAHRLSSIARAERVIVLENGKVSEEGRYDVLVSGRTSETWAWGLWALREHLLLDVSHSPRSGIARGRWADGLSSQGLGFDPIL
jgi:ATP-binding cassette subfamily B (MDR/TAP) protein 10